MDNLKHINDEYGHAEGDYCLCAIAEAMNFAAKNGEICVRSGGDEFTMIAGDYTEALLKSQRNILRSQMRRCTKKRRNIKRGETDNFELFRSGTFRTFYFVNKQNPICCLSIKNR